MSTDQTAEVICFNPVDSFYIQGSGLTVFTGPCPLDGKSDAANIRKKLGSWVEINKTIYRIMGVETHATLMPPGLGVGIGIAVRLPREVNNAA